MNLFERFATAARRVPERTCIDAGDARYSFADMLEHSGRAAAALAAAGVRAGDRVVVQVEKSPAAVWLYLGCLRAGIVYVPLNTAYTADELGYFIEDADPALVVTGSPIDESRHSGLDPGSRFSQPPAEEAGPRVKPGVTAKYVEMILTADGGGSFAEAMAAVVPDDAIAPRDDGDVAAILYTSGTTGRSKGAMLTHGNLASNLLALTDIWRWRDDDVLLHALPIFHVHGLFVALHLSLWNATPMIWHAGFDAEAVLADLPRASVLMGVPTFYVRLLKLDAFDAAAAANTRLFVSGSAPLTEPVFEAFAARTGQRILERYGMTEALMITSNPHDGERVAGSVGFALPDVSMRVADGSPGVLEIAGPNVFAGYWRNPEKTAEAFTADGWFKTGDIAEVADDGRVRLVGRSSDLVICGGYNVYPKEIELLIDALPGIEEAAVIGVPHPDFGEAVVAVVVPRAGAMVAEAEVIEAVRPSLAAFKRPKRVIVTDALPRNAMGKVEKAALRRAHAGLFADA